MTTRRQFLMGLGGALCASFLASCAGLTREDVPQKPAVITPGAYAVLARRELARIVQDLNRFSDRLDSFLIDRKSNNRVAVPAYVVDWQGRPDSVSDSMVVINAQNPGGEVLRRLGEDVDKINVVFLRMAFEKNYPDAEETQFLPNELASVSTPELMEALKLQRRYEVMMGMAQKGRIIREPQPPVAPEPVSNYDHRLQI